MCKNKNAEPLFQKAKGKVPLRYEAFPLFHCLSRPSVLFFLMSYSKLYAVTMCVIQSTQTAGVYCTWCISCWVLSSLCQLKVAEGLIQSHRHTALIDHKWQFSWVLQLSHWDELDTTCDWGRIFPQIDFILRIPWQCYQGKRRRLGGRVSDQ